MTCSGKTAVPEPAPMPVDRNTWFHELNLCNFVNSYYQYRDLRSLENCSKVLIVGPGQGLDTQVLRWRGYNVTTFDIDDTFIPDHIGSVHDLGCFGDKQFDAVIASHVLEHLSEPYLSPSLRELARVSRFALVYLPVHGRHVQLRFVPGFSGIDLSLILDLFNPLRRPDGITPRYMAKQHFWEIGMRKYRIKDLVRRMSMYFDVVSVYRNKDWIPSQNFILRSKAS
jgi:Methyltransferase domain